MSFEDNPADDRYQLDQCLDEIKRLRTVNAQLLAACEIALPEIAGKTYVAGCVDDGVSPELRRLWRVADQLNAAIKTAKEIPS